MRKKPCHCGLCAHLGGICQKCGCRSGRHVQAIAFIAGEVKKDFGCHGCNGRCKYAPSARQRRIRLRLVEVVKIGGSK